LTPSEDGKTDYHSFTVSVDDDLVRITMKNGDFYRIFINDRRFDVKKYNFDVMTMASRIFPWVYFDREGSRSLERVPDTENAIKSLLGSFSPGAFSSKPERSIFANYLATGSRDSPIEIPFLSRRELPEFLSHLPSFIQGSLKDENKIDDLYDLIIISYLGLITSFINESLNPVFDSSSYLGPIRSSGSRFYREQELSVERIDERGENFATYVSSLAPSELKSFNKILSDTFNVEIRSHATVGHISLEIARTGSGQYDNLADVGFGFSQLLPLIAQIHSVNRRRYVPFDEHGRQQIIAIEQPELHLHPAFQANLADLFVAAVTGSNTQERRLNVILETHSEALVGRLGELVVQEKISVDDIAVHFIQKDDQTGHSTVQIEKFNPDGLIENWPVGFFSARS